MLWAKRCNHEAGELPSPLPRATAVAVLPSGRSLVYREGAGRPLTHQLRESMNGIRYVLRHGIPWDAMPTQAVES